MTKVKPITIEEIKKLREQTQAGVMECRQALEESGGDMKKATDLLIARGIAKAEKKAGREVKAGFV